MFLDLCHVMMTQKGPPQALGVCQPASVPAYIKANIPLLGEAWWDTASK